LDKRTGLPVLRHGVLTDSYCLIRKYSDISEYCWSELLDLFVHPVLCLAALQVRLTVWTEGNNFATHESCYVSHLEEKEFRPQVLNPNIHFHHVEIKTINDCNLTTRRQ